MKSRKLPMEKRKSHKELSVTFTKRRQGLFSKAAELSTFCDAQIAVLVSSPSKRKIYSFGHSSVPSVLRAFLCNSPPVPNPISNDPISAVDGGDFTVEEGFLVLDDFQKSESVEGLSFLVEELGKLVDRAKRNPNYGCRTSDSAPVAGNFGNFAFSGEENRDCGTRNPDLQPVLISDNFAFAGNGNGPISGHDFDSESAAGKFAKLVEDWGKTVDFAKRNPNYECGTSKIDLQGFFLPCNQFPGGGCSDSTVTQALSVVDDPAITGNSNHNNGTRNSVLQVLSNPGSDFQCNSAYFSRNDLFGIHRESFPLVSGNYSTVSDPLGCAESNSCAVNVEFSNPLGSYGSDEGSGKSVMEEEKSWSFKDSDIAFADYWPSSS